MRILIAPLVSPLKTGGELINIDRVIVNRVRLYNNRLTVQSQTVTGNCCTHGNWMDTMMTKFCISDLYQIWPHDSPVEGEEPYIFWGH
jgi:hypothetical protein